MMVTTMMFILFAKMMFHGVGGLFAVLISIICNERKDTKFAKIMYLLAAFDMIMFVMYFLEIKGV